MTLEETVKQLDSFNEEQTIFLDRSENHSATSNSVVVWMPEDDSTPPEAEAMKCFLDVEHAKEVIEGKAHQRSLSNPSEGKLKLTVNEDKTRICKVPEGEFDFLGYAFGRMYSARTGQAGLGYRPSKTSIRRAVENIHALTDRKGTWQESQAPRLVA